MRDEEKTYAGSCHCGAVRFAVTVAIDVADGREKVIVNARCLDGVDVDGLVVQTFDGKSYR